MDDSTESAKQKLAKLVSQMSECDAAKLLLQIKARARIISDQIESA